MKRKLMFGDCLERMKEISDGSIDMVLTDPPYGTTACKWDSVIDFKLMWKQLKRIIKNNGAICLFGSEPFSSFLRISNINMFKYDWIWEKGKATGHIMCKKRPMKAHEIILIFSDNKNFYYPQMDIGKPYKGRNNNDKYLKRNNSWKINHGSRTDNKGTRYPRSVIKFKNVNKKGMHPTQKPILLLEYLIKTYTLKNETVLDFTMGSGSTGVACKNLKRNFIGIENNKKYFRIAKERIREA